MFLQQNGIGGLPGLQLERIGGESSASSPVRGARGGGFHLDSEELPVGFGMSPSPQRSAGVPQAFDHQAAEVPAEHVRGFRSPPALRKSSTTMPAASFHTATEHAVGGSHAWNEAYHAHQGNNMMAAASTKSKSNITRMDRKQAWIRFLALDASKNACIESMMSANASTSEREFIRELLSDDCKALKEGLGLSGLLLSGVEGSGDEATQANIHWDDAEECGEARIVMVDDGRRDTLSVEKRKPTGCCVVPAIEEGTFGVPSVEVKVSRVVGAPFLDTVYHDASLDEGPGEYTIRTFVKGGVPSTSAIGSTGGVISGSILSIPSSQITSVKDVLYLEVYKHGEILEACASVMISELQRLAGRSDALGQEPPPSLLKQLMHPSGFGSRKRKGSGGSMIWAKLVATDGAPAGHVLLAAKASTGDMGAGVMRASMNGLQDIAGTSGSGCGSEAMSGSGSGQAPLIPSSVHDECTIKANVKTPLQIRAHHDMDGVQRMNFNAKTHLIDVKNARVNDDLVNYDDADAEVNPNPIALASLTARRKTKNYGNVTGGYLQVNARHVYDILLDCALRSSGCDRAGSSLELQPQWSWLTKQFAHKHNIREEYATLAYLQWILENHRVQPNSMCFEVIAAKHVAMKTASKTSNLESHEVAMNTKVRQDIKSLLNKTFENYFALKQSYDDDVEFLPTRGPQAATVLRSATKLLYLVLDGDTQSAGQWMAVRIKRAANKRFYAILAAVEAQIIEDEAERGKTVKMTIKGSGKAKNEVRHTNADIIAYKKVGDLCRSLVEEIREDEAIQASLSENSGCHEGTTVAVISEHTSIEYSKGVSAHLKAVLTRYPPRKPSRGAIALVQAVGNLQDFLERHHYIDAAVRLNSFEVFSGFIHHWISSSSASLRRGVQIIDEAPGSGPEGLTWKELHENKGNMVVPFAEVLLRELQKEMEVYRPILGIWPSYALDVERACVDVLRLTITVASRHCGLVQSRSNSSKESSNSRRRTAWKWTSTIDAHGANQLAPHTREGVTDAIRYGTNVLQALLMNTLRRLLAVIPQIESTIQGWCDDRPETSVARGEEESGRVDKPVHAKSPTCLPDKAKASRYNACPDLGALWAQLVKEVRTEYYATITLTAEALSRQLSTSHVTSIQHALRKSGLEATESSIVRKSERVLDQISPTLQILSSVLDSRVFVAISRGLWDLTARHILQYAEDLTDDSGGTNGAWRGRQNAAVVLSCVENFFKHEISTCMGSDLQPKDLDPPQHFQRAKALLSKGNYRVDQSFDVY